MPPVEGGGLETNSCPRNGTRTGRRWITRYSARSRKRNRAAAGADVLGNRARQLAGREVGGAVLGQPLERPREVGHHQHVALDETIALRAVELLALGRVPQDHVEDLVQERLRLVQRDAVAGVLDRGLEQHPPGQAAEAPVRLAEPGRRARDRTRGRADPVELAGLRREVDRHLVHLAGCAARQPEARDGDEVVEQANRAVAGLVDEHEAARAGAGERALGNPGDERRGDAGVDRVPALGQCSGSRLGGERMSCCDGPTHPSRLLREARYPRDGCRDATPQSSERRRSPPAPRRRSRPRSSGSARPALTWPSTPTSARSSCTAASPSGTTSGTRGATASSPTARSTTRSRRCSGSGCSRWRPSRPRRSPSR